MQSAADITGAHAHDDDYHQYPAANFFDENKYAETFRRRRCFKMRSTLYTVPSRPQDESDAHDSASRRRKFLATAGLPLL